MTIAFDAVSSSGSDTGQTVQSHSHTTSGIRRKLFAHIYAYNGSGAPTISTVTYNSVAMTEIHREVYTVADEMIAVYELDDPATGANTLSCTLNSAGSSYMLAGMSLTDAGASKTEAVGEGTSSPSTLSPTNSNGDLVCSFFCCYLPASISVDDETERLNTQPVADDTFMGISTQARTGPPISMEWSFDGTRTYGHIALAVEEDLVSGGLSIPVARHHYAILMQR